MKYKAIIYSNLHKGSLPPFVPSSAVVKALKDLKINAAAANQIEMKRQSILRLLIKENAHNF